MDIAPERGFMFYIGRGIGMNHFIDEARINDLLNKGKNAQKEEIRELIKKALTFEGLTALEASKLIQTEDQDMTEEIFEAALAVKERIYGKRIVLFAPLYTSSRCVNDCLYCAFRVSNNDIKRSALDTFQVVEQAKAIEAQGHKRILLVCGESKSDSDASHIASALEAIYDGTDIRRINVNAAPMEVSDYKLIKSAGVGTYQLFQETYHRSTYAHMHRTGPKADYDLRLNAIEKAIEAGIDDFGIGALLGLYDYRFELLAILEHSSFLDNTYAAGPHTISVPRLKPAKGAPLTKAPYPVSDFDFKKYVAVLRLAVPYTGIILSTRENANLRDELLDLGVSQMSAGSKTNPGGYNEKMGTNGQFETDDHRTLNEVLGAICDSGFVPSFCTACYRKSRTGEKFMELAKSGHINEFCQPNSIITFKENLLDYADENVRIKGDNVIAKALLEIKDTRLRALTIEKLKEIENGARDIYL
jgi:2-iminoacetate synthase